MSKHRGSKSCPDLCVLRKVRLRCIQKSSVFATHPFTPLNSYLEGEISVHIAICKSTSKNVHDKMSCCTMTSHWNACSTTRNWKETTTPNDYQIYNCGRPHSLWPYLYATCDTSETSETSETNSKKPLLKPAAGYATLSAALGGCNARSIAWAICWATWSLCSSYYAPQDLPITGLKTHNKSLYIPYLLHSSI